MTTTEVTAQKAHAADVKVSLGVSTMPFDLVPVRVPNIGKDTRTVFTCPDHDTPARVKQFYICDDGHQHTERELGNAFIGTSDDGETLVPLTKEDLETVRNGGMDKIAIDLQVHPAAEVEAATIGDEAAYRVRPPKGAGVRQLQNYGVLLELANDETYAIVGELRLKDSRRLYRLRSHRGQLLLQSLIYPQNVAPVDDFEVPEISEALMAQGRAIIESMATPFNADAYGHDAASAMAKIVAERVAHPVVTDTPAEAPEAASDLLGALEASVAKTKGKVATPSRTPRKTAARAKRAPAKKAAKPAA